MATIEGQIAASTEGWVDSGLPAGDYNLYITAGVCLTAISAAEPVITGVLMDARKSYGERVRQAKIPGGEKLWIKRESSHVIWHAEDVA